MNVFFVSISNNVAYIPSHYDQYNRPVGLIPYDNATPANGTCSTSPAMTTDVKSIDDEHLNDFNNQHSINSEDVRRTVIGDISSTTSNSFFILNFRFQPVH